MDGHKVLLRGDIDPPLILGVVSEKYSALQNRDIFMAMDPMVQDGLLEWETAGSLRNGKTVWALLRYRENFEVGVVGNDTIRKYVLLTTTHDGTGRAILQPTPVRVVCNNTYQLALQFGEKLEFSHVGDISGRVASAADALVRLGDQFDEAAGYFRDMADVTLTHEERETYFNLVLPDAPPRAKQMQKNIEAKRELWHRWSLDSPEHRDLSGYRPDSLWSALGAVTRFSTHAVSSRVKDRSAYAIEGGGAQLGRQAFETAVAVLNEPDLLAEAAELAGDRN